jgi:hypothetical protein
MSDDGGYVSPEFDLPEDEDEVVSPPTKRHKILGSGSGAPHSLHSTLEDEEELALQFLRKR